MADRRSRRLRSGALAAAFASLVVLTGCSDEPGGTAGCGDPAPAPSAETALMPSGLTFERVGTVTHVARIGGNVTVRAVANKPLDELTVLIQDAVTAVGYQPSGMDNEGDEAEVFFTSSSFAAGQANVRQSDCAGRWNIELVLVDLRSIPSSSSAPAPG